MYEKTIEYLRKRQEAMRQLDMAQGRDMERGRDSRDYRGNYDRRDYENRGREENRDNRDRESQGRRDSRDYGYLETMNRVDRHYRKPMEYEMYGTGGINARPYYDYRDNERERDYNYNYGSSYDYDSQDLEKRYKEDLHKWVEKLKSKDKFKVQKEQILHEAKNMGVKFDKFTEEEFYATYLMLVSDFYKISTDYKTFIVMAKLFLEDDDIAVTPSEKICIYMYEIVMGDK